MLLKDSIGTRDMMNTTLGSYALMGAKVPRDATVVERLGNAGAVILGKTSLTLSGRRRWLVVGALEVAKPWYVLVIAHLTPILD